VLLKTILTFLIFLTGPLQAVDNSSYSSDDLEVLAQQKNYPEFLEHAHDIRPSKRNKKWKKMVRDMTLGYMNQTLKDNKHGPKIFQFVEQLNSWPSLRNEEFFHLKRNQLGIKYFKSCVNSKKDCLPQALNFWTSNQLKSAELGLKMIDLLEKVNYRGDLFKFIKPATTSDMSEFYCNRPEVITILIKKIHHISLKNAPDKKYFKNIFNQDCIKKIIPILKQELVKFSSPAMKEIFYNFLDLYKGINQEESDFFLTLYILQGPIKGDAFNKGWNTISILGKNFKRRQKVLRKLKKFELLPDDIFTLTNKKAKRILLDHFFKNIPEYLDYYARTCLNYLEGTKEFPRGNPTLHCKELFYEAKGTKWIDPGLQTSFLKFKKL